MADDIKKIDGSQPEQTLPESQTGDGEPFGFRLTGGPGVGVPTGISPASVLGSVGLQFHHGFTDASFYIGPSFDYNNVWLKNWEAGGGEGSTVKGRLWTINLDWGKLLRSVDSEGKRGAVDRIMFGSKEAGFGFGKWYMGDGSRNVDGVSDPTNSGAALQFRTKYYLAGFEVNSGRFVFGMDATAMMSTTYLLAGSNTRENWALASPQNILFSANVFIGYNDGNDGHDKEHTISTQDSAPTVFDHIYDLTTYGVSFCQRFVAWSLRDKDIARSTGFISDSVGGGGSGGQQSSDINFFQMLSSAFGAFGISAGADLYHRARISGQSGLAVGGLVVKGLGGAVSLLAGLLGGAGGDGLAATGLDDLQLVLTGGLTETNFDARLQMMMRFIVGAGLQLGGAAAGADWLMQGGGNGAVAATFSPDATNSHILGAFSIYYTPYSLENDGHRGALRLRWHLGEIADHVAVATDTEIITPNVAVANAGKQIANLAGAGKSLDSVQAASAIRSGLALEFPLKFWNVVTFTPSFGGMVFQQFGGEKNTAGVEANADVDLMFDLLKIDAKKMLSLNLNAKVFVDKPIGASTVLGFQSALGLTFTGF